MLKKTKSYTIRVDSEMNKYKCGYIYDCFSYKDTEWKIKIKIEKIYKIKISELSNYGIPKRSINSLMVKTKLNFESKVELIKFSYIN